MGRSQLRYLALVGAVLMVVAACGSTSSGPAAKQVKVGLVTDIGGLNDKSFNHLAYVGLQKAIADFNVKGEVTESKTGDDYVPNLTNFYVVAGGVTTGGDPNPRRAAVYAAYKAKLHKDAPLGEQTLNGYSAVYAFKTAIERAQSTDGAKVIAQLEKFRNEPLPIGNITWTHACHISKLRSLTIITFVGAKEKFVAQVSPKASILPHVLC